MYDVGSFLKVVVECTWISARQLYSFTGFIFRTFYAVVNLNPIHSGYLQNMFFGTVFFLFYSLRPINNLSVM